MRPVRTRMRRHMWHPAVPRLLLQQHAEETFRLLRPEILDEAAKICDPSSSGLRRLISSHRTHPTQLWKIPRYEPVTAQCYLIHTVRLKLHVAFNFSCFSPVSPFQ